MIFLLQLLVLRFYIKFAKMEPNMHQPFVAPKKAFNSPWDA